MSINPFVAHLVISLAPGGLERLVADWTSTRNRRCPESTLICCLDEAGDLAEQVSGDMPCVHADRSRFPFDIGAVRRLRQVLRERGVDVLHSHNIAAHQYGVLACVGTGVRHVQTRHGTDLHLRGFVNRLRNQLLARSTDQVVAVSADTARAMENAGWPRRISVIQNGVSPHPEYAAANIESLRRTLGIGPNAFVIGSIGRLAHVKGHDRLIRAFALLNSAKCKVQGEKCGDEKNTQSSSAKATEDKHSGSGKSEAHHPASCILDPASSATLHLTPCTLHSSASILLLVGSGPERSALERQVNEAGLTDRVIFTGFQQEPRMFLDLMSLFVLPSRSEGLSVALLEAMAAGVPVAVTDVGANREVIEDGRCGVLLPDDEAKWAEVIRGQRSEVRSQKSERERRTGRALTRVNERYSLEQTVNAYEAIYGQLGVA